MSISHDEVLKSALSLPESDRILLATELLDSLPGTPPGMSIDDPEFEAELERRFADGSKSIPWEIVSQQLDNDLNK